MKKTFLCFITSLLITVSTPLAQAEPINEDALPDYGDPSQVKLTPADEKKMGTEFMGMLRSSGHVLADPIDQEYLSDIGARLVRGSVMPNRHFEFFWFASPSINAFTGPDGYIAIHTQLMLASANEDELAGVMAHEIGHVTQNHLARGMAVQSKVGTGTIAGVLAAIAIGMVAPGAAAGAVTAAMAGGEQQMLNYSRAHEAEADRVGIKVLANAQFDPWGMPNFFKRLLQDERLYQGMSQLLNDHPLTQERITDTENRTSAYPKKPAVSPLAYYLIKERIRVQSAKNPRTLIESYQRVLRNKTYENEMAAEYGEGLALMENHRARQAIDVFQSLLTRSPEEIIFQLALANALEDTHQMPAALTLLEPLYQKNRASDAVMIHYVRALLRDNQPKKALDILENDRLNYPQHPIPFGALADAQSQSGDVAGAYQTRANYLLVLGQTTDAIDQLKMALQVSHIDSDTKDRIQAQLDSLNRIRKQST